MRWIRQEEMYADDPSAPSASKTAKLNLPRPSIRTDQYENLTVPFELVRCTGTGPSRRPARTLNNLHLPSPRTLWHAILLSVGSTNL